MSVLAHSELLSRIMGIEEEKLEKPFQILAKTETTQNRFNILKNLAIQEKATIGKILKTMHQNRSGGSYLTIKKYFLNLEKEGLLKKETQNKKTLWMFSENAANLKEFILK